MDEIAFFRILGFVTLQRLSNLFRAVLGLGLSALLRRPVVLGLPFALKVEPTNLCNLQCPQCATGQGGLTRPRGRMKLAHFVRLMDDTAGHVFYLLLYFQGEPFLNNEILELLRHARDKRIYSIVSTNGHFFRDDAFAEEVVTSGLESVIISLDGATADTYTKYRRGGDFGRVVRGVRRLVAAKQRLSSATPLICLQFIAMRHNLHEVNQVKALARSLGVDRLLIKPVNIYYSEGTAEILPTDGPWSRHTTPSPPLPVGRRKGRLCRMLWTSAAITWDGVLVPCCFDQDARHPLGNAFGPESFRSLWFSERYGAFRNKVLTNSGAIPMCASCKGNVPYLHVGNLPRDPAVA